MNLGLEWNPHLKGIGSAFADISRLSQTMTENLGRWTTLTSEFSAIGQLDKVLREHSSFLNGLAGRTLLGASLLEHHSAMFSTFEQLTDVLRVPTLAWADKLDLTRHALDSADDFVRASQGYFQSPRLRSPGEWNTPGPAGERARTTQREIIATAIETDELVHTTTGRVLRLERNTALFVSEIIDTQLETRLAPYAPLFARLTALASPPSFTELLREFATTFARDHWRTLWSKEGVEFKPGPEEIAQSSLTLFLQGHLRGCAFVGRELKNGDGFVDVLVNFLGTEYVVEIKIVGASWGVGAAKAGLTQLDEYVRNYGAAEAFLLVFDGRRTERGERLDDEYTLASGAKATVVRVRCFFEAPSRR